jgi:hypothetical protein
VEAGATSADAVATAIGSAAADADADGTGSADAGDLPSRRASVALARLELLGYVAPTAVGTFTRTLLTAPTTTVA